MKLLTALFALICSLTFAQPPPQRQEGPPRGGPPGGNRNAGPLGGRAAGFVLNPTIDKVPPEIPLDLKSGGVLIFSKTSGFREEAAIEASNTALAVIAKIHGWPYFITENGAVMNPAQLQKFKLVIWNNTSGDSLSEEQRAAFQTWVETGGSFLGIHGAGGDPASFPAPRTVSAWKWFIETLLGAQFTSHAHIMPGDIHIEDTKSPITKGLPAVWRRAEEWYAFTASPRGKPGYRILATVDEKSYEPGRSTMGADHPLIWWHCVGKGHSLYSALGHAGTMYTEPLMIQFLENAMSWGLTQSGKGCSAAK